MCELSHDYQTAPELFLQPNNISIDAQRAGLSDSDNTPKTMEQYCKKHTKKSKLWKISNQPIKKALKILEKVTCLHPGLKLG